MQNARRVARLGWMSRASSGSAATLHGLASMATVATLLLGSAAAHAQTPPSGTSFVETSMPPQDQPAPANSPPASSPFVAPAAPAAAGAPDDSASAGASAAAAPAAPSGAAPAKPPASSGGPSGYSYGDHDTPSILAASSRGTARGTRRSKNAGAGPVATYPGFSMRDDGGSRVFVQLTKAVVVEEHRAAGQLTYLLKGAHVVERNNENALVTLHFNTPVTRARLAPSGRDLALTIELRAPVTPVYKIEDAEGGSRLVVDFPEGQYLDGDGEPLRATNADSMTDAGGANGTGKVGAGTRASTRANQAARTRVRTGGRRDRPRPPADPNY